MLGQPSVPNTFRLPSGLNVSASVTVSGCRCRNGTSVLANTTAASTLPLSIATKADGPTPIAAKVTSLPFSPLCSRMRVAKFCIAPPGAATPIIWPFSDAARFNVTPRFKVTIARQWQSVSCR